MQPQHCEFLPGTPFLISHTWITGESVGLSHWGSDYDGEGGGWSGLTTTSTCIMADQVHTCRAQVGIPTSSFAHLQNHQKYTLTRRRSRAQLCLIQILRHSFASLRASPRQGSKPATGMHCRAYDPAPSSHKGC